MQLQLRTDDDHRTAGIVDALAEQVLAEASLLSFQHVGERLERAVVVAPHGVDAPGVVEQRIDRLLQHPLFIPQDHFRRLDVDQALQAVVPDDHAAVQIVQIRRREPSAFQGNERTQFRRDHRNNVQHHPVGTVERSLLRSRNASTTRRRFSNPESKYSFSITCL